MQIGVMLLRRNGVGDGDVGYRLINSFAVE